jgi:hypothetical protein
MGKIILRFTFLIVSLLATGYFASENVFASSYTATGFTAPRYYDLLTNSLPVTPVRAYAISYF